MLGPWSWIAILLVVVVAIIVFRPRQTVAYRIVFFEVDDSVPHRHKCPKCGHIWSHTTAEAMKDPRAHNCPSCGTEERYVYFEP